ncbi:MAG: response regulator transcription factor, partial [Muribaculaceae bacterium]
VEHLELMVKPVEIGSRRGDAVSHENELTPREREIVACIARGLSTKEVADRLNLSAHTVNTHRRNINSKLDMHSASAITLYAIMNGIIDISEVKKS